MGIEAQSEFFVSKFEGPNGKTLSVFYAPKSAKFTVPKEVLRAKSADNFASSSLWKLITGDLPAEDYETPTIEPSSIEQVGSNLGEFMRDHIGGVFVDETAPEVIKDTLQSVEEVLNAESRTRLANFLGIDISAPIEDNRPYPGQYL